MSLICPNCRTRIDPNERCGAEHGLGRCMAQQGHDGFHWTDVGRGDGGLMIWFGPYANYNCAGHLELDDWCTKMVGHQGTHHSKRRGFNWIEEQESVDA